MYLVVRVVSKKSQQVKVMTTELVVKTVCVFVCAGGPWVSSRLIVALKLNHSAKVITPL